MRKEMKSREKLDRDHRLQAPCAMRRQHRGRSLQLHVARLLLSGGGRRAALFYSISTGSNVCRIGRGGLVRTVGPASGDRSSSRRSPPARCIMPAPASPCKKVRRRMKICATIILVARVSEAPASVEFSRFRILPRRREVVADGRPIGRGGRAFDKLMALIETDGAVVRKDELRGPRVAGPGRRRGQSARIASAGGSGPL